MITNVDDSYREAPLDVAEASREGLRPCLEAAVAELGSAPKDFSSMLTKSTVVGDESRQALRTPTPCRAGHGAGLATGCSGIGWRSGSDAACGGAGTASDGGSTSGGHACAAPAAQSDWRPNAGATEFIPTLSMACPAVGFCHFAGSLDSPGYVLQICGNETTQPSGLTPQPRTPTFPSDFSKRVGAQSGAREGPGRWWVHDTPTPHRRKEVGSARKARGPARKRQSSPMSAAGSNAGPDEKQQRRDLEGSETTSQVEEITEADWQQRGETRKKSVTIGKETAEYRWFEELRRRQEACSYAGFEVPRTPDPMDSSIRKRRWKYDLHNWRSALKQLYLVTCPDAKAEAPCNEDVAAVAED